MLRITRLVVFESDDDTVLAKQLAQSLPEGIKKFGKLKITIIKLSSEPLIDGIVSDLSNGFAAKND